MREQVRKLRDEVINAKTHIAELNKLLTTYVALSRRLNLPPEIDMLIRKAMQGKIAIEGKNEYCEIEGIPL